MHWRSVRSEKKKSARVEGEKKGEGRRRVRSLCTNTLSRATLNVCLAYTARDEMTRAMRKIADTAERAREFQRTGQLRRANEGDEGRVLQLVQGGEGALVQPPVGKDGWWGEGDREEESDREGEEGKKTWGWEDEMWNAMDINSAPELLVRTSGEIRFSDFLLWQVCTLPLPPSLARLTIPLTLSHPPPLTHPLSLSFLICLSDFNCNRRHFRT
jgi:hypothetical protein